MKRSRSIAAILAISAFCAVVWTVRAFLVRRSGSHTVPSLSVVAKPTYPTTIRIAVDTSASMKGYLEGDTQFKDNVAQIAASMDKLRISQSTNLSIQYDLMGDRGSLEQTSFDTKTFIEAMRSNRLMQRQDSLLQNAFDRIIESSTPSEVTFLISDSIISYPDADIRANPRINIDNISSLGSEVETIFSRAKVRNQAILLLASTSDFHGTYFDYQNHKTQCCSGKRPYYIWAIGPRDQIRSTEDFLKTENVRIDHEMYFSNTVYTPEAAVLQTFDRVGTFYRDRTTKTGIEIKRASNGAPIHFAVAVNFAGLPPYMQNSDFLREHLHVTSGTTKATVVAIKRKDEAQGQKTNDAPALLPEYTHIIVLAVDSTVIEGETLEISIDRRLPSWYLAWSNKDDTDTATATPPTTFGLSYLCEGISRAYDSSEPAARITITVRK